MLTIRANVLNNGIVNPLKMVCYLVLKCVDFTGPFWYWFFELGLKIVVFCTKKQQGAQVVGCILKD